MKQLSTILLCFATILSFAQTEGDQFFADLSLGGGTVHEIRLDFSQVGYWCSLVANMGFCDFWC